MRELPDCTVAFFPNLGASAHFLTTRLHGGYHPDDGSIFPHRKPILFNNITMHLIHSYIHFDLDHSCSTLMSRDIFPTTRMYGGTLPDCTVAFYPNLGASAHFLTTRLHGATTLMMAAFFPVENRSFSMILLCT